MGRLRSVVLFTCVVAGGVLAAPETGGAAGPAPVPEAGATNWKQISAGTLHSCALKTNGRLFCWGRDSSGQLGDDDTLAEEPTPVELAGGAKNWKQVSAGNVHTCAIKTSGRLFCWGSDTNGQLGDDAPESNKPTPVQVAGGAKNWKQVSAGGSHTCAVKTSGRLFCWGDDEHGQLGDDAPEADKPTPVQVAGATKDWKQVSTGRDHTCAVKSSGLLFCWGRDDDGQVGDDPNLADQPIPVEVAGGADNWKQISAGGAHTCGVLDSQRALCWGDDGSGQLGDNASLADKPTPELLTDASTDWRKISAGNVHTCGIKITGLAFCWGDDTNGRLGDNPEIGIQPTPKDVAGSATDWKLVSAGGFHTCALKTNRRAFCWGSDLNGGLGDDATKADKPTPVEVAG